jgi:flagellar biosynthesis/type III secretory pathway protein FliH
MSLRSFFYENFDEALQASIGGSIGDPEAALPEREPRPRTELEIARRESFDAGRTQGFAEGRRAALEEAGVRLARDLPELLVNLGGAAAAMDAAKRTCERDALRLADAVLRQMLPILGERGLDQEAAALVARVITNVPAPAIEVRACQRTRDTIEQRCGPLPSGVTLTTDPDLPEGGVRCVWAHGEARFDGAAVREAALAILDRCLDRADQDLARAPQNQTEKEN